MRVGSGMSIISAVTFEIDSECVTEEREISVMFRKEEASCEKALDKIQEFQKSNLARFREMLI